MAKFKKGNSGNPNGRPKGAKNKTSTDLRELISNFLLENFETIQADFDELQPMERAKVFRDLLQYGLPKIQAISEDIDKEPNTINFIEVII